MRAAFTAGRHPARQDSSQVRPNYQTLPCGNVMQARKIRFLEKYPIFFVQKAFLATRSLPQKSWYFLVTNDP